MITIYSIATGAIKRTLSCREVSIPFNIKEGEGYVEGEFSSTDHYIYDGILHAYSEDEILLMASVPLGWKWQMPERIAVDTRALEQAKATAASRINVDRDRAVAFFDRFTYDSVIYDGNAAAQENIRVAAFIANSNTPLPEGFSWRSFDNVDVPMNKEQLLGLQIALLQSLAAVTFNSHKIARDLKSEIESATTNEQVDAIKWPTK